MTDRKFYKCTSSKPCEDKNKSGLCMLTKDMWCSAQIRTLPPEKRAD